MKKLRPDMFRESECSKAPSNPALQILIFLAVFIVIYLAEGIGASVFALPYMVSELLKNGGATMDFNKSYELSISLMSDWKIMIPSLYCTILGTVLSIIFCRFIERRTLSSMGIRRRKAVPHYLQGLIVGIVMMSLIVLFEVLSGAMKISVLPEINIGIILLFFVGYLIQGMSEEFIFRGYLMNTVGGKHSAAAALTVSSIAFACAHLSNPGINLLAFANLILFAVFAGFYMICFDDIWGACAIHSIWNFTQGNIFGISVSGTGYSDSVLRTTAVSENVLLTGGDFGIEGSIFTTIILTASTALVVFKICKQQKQSKPVPT